MSANLGRVLAALESIGIDPTAREAVEALWLAARIAERAGEHAHEPVQPPALSNEERATPRSTAPEPTPASPPTPRPLRSADTAAPAALHAPAPTRRADDTSPRAVAIRVPDAPALSGELQLLRALRPLKRRVPSRHRVQLDETATAERSAEERLFLPATRPEPDRWLSLALVVEASPTMAVWRSLVSELMALLQRSAAFRDIRLWHLHTRPDGTRVGLHPQMVPTGALHSPREILDPTGRQAIWCISDCVSALWRDGRADRLLELWGRAGPLAIVQPLPQRLWRRSGLRPERVLLRTDTPGAPNSLLRVASPDNSVLLRGLIRGIPVPILELEPAWLTPWTRLVTATAHNGVSAVVTMTRVAPESSDALGTSDGGITPPAGRPGEPLELVRAFRANSSPQAYRLAGCLAAAPLTLPVMRLVQRVMLPMSRPAHLAEVLLSGLLQRTGPDPADLEYDFLDGVRDVLLSTLRRSESRRVHDEVSAYLEAHAGDARDTPALAVPSSGRGSLGLPATSRPFAEIKLRGDRHPADSAPGCQQHPDTPVAALQGTDRPAGPTWEAQLSDFLSSAQPGGDPDQGSLFTGRHAALVAISRWLDEAVSTPDQNVGLWRRGLAVVTADPGSGKSALLARIAVLASSNRHPETLHLPPEVLPSPGVLDVVMSARNSTDQDVLDRLAAVTAAQEATVDAIVAALDARSDGRRPLTAVIDAADEAADPGRLFAEVLLPLLHRSEGRIRLLLAVRRHSLPIIRDEPYDTGRDALVIDLDGPPYADFEALKAYAARNLASPPDSPYRSSAQQREDVAQAVADAAGYSFLTARIISSVLALGTRVFDPAEAPLSSSAADAMRLDLAARLGDQAHRAIDLLTPLAFAQGGGLPWQDIWAPLASAISGQPYTDEDVRWLQTAAGSYVHRTSESGTSVYRTCHSVIDEYLRDRTDVPGVHDAFFDTLTARLPYRADGTRDWSSAHPYALAYLAHHACEAGRLDVLLEDAEYLVRVVPHRLAPYLEQARSRQASLAAAAFQSTVDVPDAERRGNLALAAARVGATGLLRQLVDGAAPQQWMPLWATGNDRVPAGRVGPGAHGLAVTVACTVVHARPVAVTGHRDGTVVLLDLTENRTLGVPLTGHSGSVVAVACTVVDGRPVAVTGGNDGTVRLWDLEAGSQLGAPFTGHGRPVTAVACTVVDGRPVAVTGGYDGTIRLWDLRSGRQLGAPLVTRSWPVTAVACTVVDGRPVAVTGGYDGALTLWDLESSRKSGEELTGHDGLVLEVACTVVDGRPVAVTGGYDGTVRLWDLEAGSQLGAPVTGHSRPVTAVDCTVVDGRPVAVTGDEDGVVRLWDLRHGGRLAGPTRQPAGAVTAVACTVVDGRSMAVIGGRGNEYVMVRELGSQFDGSLVPSRPRVNMVNMLACIQRDDTALAVTADSDQILSVWDLSTRRQLFRLVHPDHAAATMACTLLRGAPVAVTGGIDGTAKLWDLTDGSHLGIPRAADEGPVTAVACTMLHDQPVAVIGGDNTLAVWGLEDLRPIMRHHGVGSVTAVACTTVDTPPIAVIGDHDGVIRLWAIESTSQLGTPLAAHAGPVTAVACTVVDGRPMAVTGGHDGAVRLWDVLAGQSVGASLITHGSPVTAVACAVIDGRPLAVTGGQDGTVRLWDVQARRQLQFFATAGHNTAAFTHDGRLALGLGSDLAVLHRSPASREPHHTSRPSDLY